MVLRFYKEYDKWYADIAEQDGFTKEDMQMVSGADTLCDIIAQGEDEIFITLYADLYLREYVRFKTTLKKIREDEFGAWYKVGSIYQVDYEDMEIWLCPVTKWLFGDYPEIIFLDY